MVLRLDPRFPLLWRTPHSLQLGLDRPRVVLEEVSPAAELVIAALVAGVSRSGAQMIGRSAGLGDLELDALLGRLEPALERQKVPGAAPVSAVVIGAGETANRLSRLLGESGIDVLGDHPAAEPEIAVIVAHYVIEPRILGHWLRRDIPHIAVVFSDEVVRIGPIIRPGTAPCLYCFELHRTDADPSWPAMASQLWQRRSGTESSLLAGEVAAIVARMVLTRQVVHRIRPATTIEIDAATGERTMSVWEFHPDCGCASLASERMPAERAQAERAQAEQAQAEQTQTQTQTQHPPQELPNQESATANRTRRETATRGAADPAPIRQTTTTVAAVGERG